MAEKSFWGIASLVVIVVLVIGLILNGIPATSTWSASSSTANGVVVMTATGSHVVTSSYVTTNWLGQTTTATTAYTTTGVYTYSTTSSSSSSIVTTTGAITPWLTFTISGMYQLLDKDGNVIIGGTFSWLPYGLTTGNVTHMRYDFKYVVDGAGIDWTTLDVNVAVSGLSAQPSTLDPNTPTIINTVPNVDAINHAKVKNGHLSKSVSIESFIGGKNFDKTRPLSTSIRVTGTATAKVLTGLSIGGSDTANVNVGPVSGLSHLQWKEDIVTPPTPPPSQAYSGALSEKSFEKTPSGSRGYSLLGLNTSLIEIYGADSQSSNNSDTQLGIVVALVVVAGLGLVMVQRRRKKRNAFN